MEEIHDHDLRMTHVLIPELSIWVPKSMLAAFELEHGRYPETIAELDTVKWDKKSAPEFHPKPASEVRVVPPKFPKKVAFPPQKSAPKAAKPGSVPRYNLPKRFG